MYDSIYIMTQLSIISTDKENSHKYMDIQGANGNESVSDINVLQLINY